MHTNMQKKPWLGMSYEEVNHTGVLTFPGLEDIPFVIHAFSTRKGGISPAPYQTMNLNFGRGDKDENVRENFRIFCDAAGIEPASLVASAQTHTVNLLRVGAAHRGAGVWRAKEWTDIDGLLTDEAGVTLVTYYADCVPLFFVDPVHQAVGLAHSGWKGTAARIGACMVQRMQHEFGTDPGELKAAVGPSIGPCCYEVDRPVMEVFKRMEDLEPDCFITQKSCEKYMVDLWEANRRILLAAGIPSSSIYEAKICTRCHSELLWSHRATGGIRGGMAAFLGIRGEIR